jgi:hypothetical protein
MRDLCDRYMDGRLTVLISNVLILIMQQGKRRTFGLGLRHVDGVKVNACSTTPHMNMKP